jgi:organic hydroperoxide reductase OsmC/OhrA
MEGYIQAGKPRKLILSGIAACYAPPLELVYAESGIPNLSKCEE